uniref:7TM_GPCR_Srx domain-containing protein n=1 Tax=Caenorhabditis tropicalis TaxID=1561998 RepID=A0A1I7UIH8_9PELO
MWSDYNETNCQPNYSYFGSSDYLRNAYHIIAFFTIPLSLFTFYVILKVTPERMKNMRIPLLIAHSWSTNLDLMFTIFTRPYVFGPSSSGMPLGILGELGIPVKWQFYWAQVSSSSEFRMSNTLKFYVFSDGNKYCDAIRESTQSDHHYTVLSNSETQYTSSLLSTAYCIFIYSLHTILSREYGSIGDEKDYFGAYNNQSTLVMSSHGLLSTICTLFVYRPYRDYINCMITGKKEEGSATVAIGSAVDSYI